MLFKNDADTIKDLTARAIDGLFEKVPDTGDGVSRVSLSVRTSPKHGPTVRAAGTVRITSTANLDDDRHPKRTRF